MTSWYDHPADRELLAITPVLEKLAYAPNVKEIIPTLKSENQLVQSEVNKYLESTTVGTNVFDGENGFNLTHEETFVLKSI